MAALDYFERLGHDNHRRLCRIYGWEEKKTKAAWGGTSVDYRIIGEKAVRGMSTPEVQHFLVVCSLVSDLYCPGYNPKQALAKDSNLASAAARYKIDTAKLATEVRSELAAHKEERSDGESLKQDSQTEVTPFDGRFDGPHPSCGPFFTITQLSRPGCGQPRPSAPWPTGAFGRNRWPCLGTSPACADRSNFYPKLPHAMSADVFRLNRLGSFGGSSPS